MTTSRSMKIAKIVMNLLKRDTLSSHDIIPFDDLPFLYPSEMGRYVAQFGPGKMAAYLQHSEKSRQVRTLAYQLFPQYKKTLRNPGSTLKVAISLCGVGECDETSQRAALEILARDCQDKVNLIVLRGKPCVTNPDPKISSDYYGHMIIVIGCIRAYNNKYINPRDFFQNLPASYILFDASFKLIGAANKTPQLLASLFKHYEINSLAEIVEIESHTMSQVAYAKSILCKAQEISEFMLKALNIKNEKQRSNQNLFFSQTEKRYRDFDNKPTSLLFNENDFLDWETCMRRYKAR